MANESNTISVDVINPNKTDVTIDGTTGTLDGSHVLEIRFLKSEFDSEGHIKLIKALEKMAQAIQKSGWPLTNV